MCTDQYAFLRLRVEACDDVRRLQYRAVIGVEVGFLFLHLTAILLELLHYPLAALFVCCRVHQTWSELTLCRSEGVCRVSIERRTHRFCRSHGVSCIVVVACFSLAAIGNGCQRGCQEAAEKEFYISFHFLL